MLQLAKITTFRNAPDGSWINPVERAMSFFNLPLAGRGFARDKCSDEIIEHRIKNLNTMADLRAAAVENEEIRKGWEESVGRSKRELVNLMSRVKVNDKYTIPFELKDIAEDINTLQKMVIFKYEYSLECTTKAHLHSNRFAKFKERVIRGIKEEQTQMENTLPRLME